LILGSDEGDSITARFLTSFGVDKESLGVLLPDPGHCGCLLTTGILGRSLGGPLLSTKRSVAATRGVSFLHFFNYITLTQT